MGILMVGMVIGLVLGTILGRWQERRVLDGELMTGECTIGRCTYLVRAIEFDAGQDGSHYDDEPIRRRA